MAYFWIKAFPHADQVAQGDVIAKERVDFTAGEMPSVTVVNNDNKQWYCRISTDTNCQYETGESPSVDTASAPLWVSNIEYVWLGRGHKFSVNAVLA